MQVQGRTPPSSDSVTLAFVAPWECSRAVANIPRAPRDDVIVVLLESVAKGASLPWHRQKLVLLLSAMRHFAASLEAAGYRVMLRRAPSYAEGLRDLARETNAARVVASEGREQDMVDELARADALLRAEGVALTLREDRGFLATRAICSRVMVSGSLRHMAGTARPFGHGFRLS